MHTLRPARHLRRDDRAGGLAQAAQRDARDRVHVDRLVQRLAHAHVLQRVLAFDVAADQFIAVLVHAKEDGAVLDTVHDLEVAVLAQARQVLRTGVEHEIDLTRQQRGHARGRGLHRRVDDLGDIGLCTALAPPVGVAREHHFLILRPLLQNEGTGAHRIAVREVLVLRLDVLGRDGVVLLRPGLAHHAQLGELVHQHRIGALGEDVDRVVVDLDDAVDALDVRGEVRGRRHRALEREHRVIGREV